MANRKNRARRNYVEQHGPFKQGVSYEAIPLEIEPGQSLNDLITSVLNQYHKSWVDTPLPALGNRTPREASKSIEGQRELENVFEYMRTLPVGNALPFPFEEIKMELGMSPHHTEEEDNGLDGLDRIIYEHGTFDFIVQMIERVGEGYQLPSIPRPLEYGLLIIDENDEILFDQNGPDLARFIWYKNKEGFATFECNIKTMAVDNIKTKEKMEETPDVYEPFFRIVNAYIGSMMFLNMFQSNKQAVTVIQEGQRRTYNS